MEARAEPEDDGIRFEDLTVDDDLPIIERIVRYTGSQIALQRLVHVKMLAEAAHLAGRVATQKVLIPMLENLLTDAEAVIRQHIAGQLLQLSLIAMVQDETVLPKLWQNQPLQPYHDFHPEGYQIVIQQVIPYLAEFLRDPEVDVRRAASDSLAGLALQLTPHDVQTHCLPIPLKLAHEKPITPSQQKKRTEAEQRMEELRTTACNLLAEMGGAASEHERSRPTATTWVHETILPAILELCQDDSFRVRRSAAQALPRVMGASSVLAAREQIVPAFEQLSQDDIHRVRKSTGECLVDMSRALMMLAASATSPQEANQLAQLRRDVLLPIADRLIQDSHKQVRQGMMQFLGPFMASFYPYQTSQLSKLLPTFVESDGSHHLGIVAQFFPHASSMVARLNSSQNAIMTTPTPVHSSLEPFMVKTVSECERLHRSIPQFIHASRASRLSLQAVVLDRQHNPPDPQDLEAVMNVLLDYFAALSVVNTGDENTDAEMRVYCAYSFPALVLLLGPEYWEGSMRTCFLTLLNPNYGQEEEPSPEGSENADGANAGVEPPLPVKRCLASSLHTVAYILGPEIAVRDIVPAVQEYFLPDADDSVRLNMIRNFASLLQILPPPERRAPFLVWSEVVNGESFLGGRKRSASNPLVLNWRQRSYLARSLPEIIHLLAPDLLKEHVWPILQILLTDSVNDVRDDALWSVSGLVQRGTCVEVVQKNGAVDDPAQFCKQFTSDILSWIFTNVLASPMNQQTGKTRPTNFSDRQVYCRICGSLGLALRLSDANPAEQIKHDPVGPLMEKIQNLFPKNDFDIFAGPYRKMSPAEYETVKTLLVDSFLPRAVLMKEDRISNVRITLMRMLQILPKEIRQLSHIKTVLKDLEDESETWTSFGESMNASEEDSEAASTIQSSVTSRKSKKAARKQKQQQQQQQQEQATAAANLPSPPDLAEAAEESSSSSDEPLKKTSSIRTVVFDDGPIGMQLEPTKEDRACRIYGFNDFGDKLSPAQASGLIEIGDVIVSVNGTHVSSYDDTIELLKAGGKRVVCFRQGTEAERYVSDEGSVEEDDDEEEEPVEDKEGEELKRQEQLKKSKKEAKKAKKGKKEKHVEEIVDQSAEAAKKKKDDADRKARKEARRNAARNDDASAASATSFGSEGSVPDDEKSKDKKVKKEKKKEKEKDKKKDKVKKPKKGE